MKAIILEKRDGWAAALREDGVVVKTRLSAAVGETVELDEKIVDFPAQGAKRPAGRGAWQSKRFLRGAVAAVLALAITGGAYTYTNVAEASYVTLDTQETSVELAFNRVGRVVAVRALDDGSKPMAREMMPDLRHMRVEDAVDAAMLHMGDAPTFVVGVTGETERGTDSMREAAERGAHRREHKDMEFHAFEVSPNERREARGRDMSGGRMAFERGGGAWREPPPPKPDGESPSDGQTPPPPKPDGETPPDKPAQQEEQ